LRGAGYAAPFVGIADGVAQCVRTLLAQSRVNA
jgi:hypothetical protein